VSDRTGIARGTLSSPIYFERSDGKIDLPVYEAGHPELARQVFESARYKYHPTEKWEWREDCHTLADIDRLNQRLVDQEVRQNDVMYQNHVMLREMVRARVASSLRQTMCSSSTSPFEREFIQHYLNLRDQNHRDKYGQALLHHNYFLMAREYDSNTQIIDVAPDQPGDFWRTPEQQKS
jgi:hypothetical protein